MTRLLSLSNGLGLLQLRQFLHQRESPLVQCARYLLVVVRRGETLHFTENEYIFVFLFVDIDNFFQISLGLGRFLSVDLIFFRNTSTSDPIFKLVAADSGTLLCKYLRFLLFPSFLKAPSVRSEWQPYLALGQGTQMT